MPTDSSHFSCCIQSGQSCYSQDRASTYDICIQGRTGRTIQCFVHKGNCNLQAVVHDWPQVALFSENSSRWLVADQAIMLCGAADAVRGASSPPHELAYIMRQSDSSGKQPLSILTTPDCR